MHFNTIRRIKQERLDWIELHQCLIHGDVNLLGKNISITKKSIRMLLHASKEIYLAVKKQAAKYGTQ
jgi:hypothetical protein